MFRQFTYLLGSCNGFPQDWDLGYLGHEYLIRSQLYTFGKKVLLKFGWGSQPATYVPLTHQASSHLYMNLQVWSCLSVDFILRSIMHDRGDMRPAVLLLKRYTNQ